MKKPNITIKKIYLEGPNELKEAYMMIGVPLMYTIIFIYMWNISNDILFKLIIISLEITAISFPFIVLFIRPIEPLILYDNGISLYESKYKIKLTGKRNFYHFDSVMNIEKIYPFKKGMCVALYLSKRSYKKFFIKDHDTYKLILETFYKYKEEKQLKKNIIR